jgi:hypothetical protein
MSAFIGRRHAELTAAKLRHDAEEDRRLAAEKTGRGDRFGASISATNARLSDEYARRADEAAKLLGDPEGGAA